MTPKATIKLNFFKTILLGCVLTLVQPIWAQEGQLIDKVIAVVGKEVVKYSDVQRQKAQYLQQGIPVPKDADCFILEDLMFQALLLHQADVDSIEVDENQVQGEMDRRLRYFIQQIGSQEKLEEFYGKTIAEIKDEFYDQVSNNMKAQQMQSKITGEVSVTPKDVKNFYKNYPKDSLPLVDAQIVVAQMTIEAKVSDVVKKRISDQLTGWKEEIESGASKFTTLALFNSDDPGSAAKGGDLGWVPRGNFVPEFEARAFSMPLGKISEPFETQFGMHILEVIDRRGNEVHARHILKSFEVDATEMVVAKDSCEAIRKKIMAGTFTFEDAVQKYSHDTDTKNAKGIMFNVANESIQWDVSSIDPYLFNAIDGIQPGEISNVSTYKTQDNKTGYRLVKLISRSEPHKANIKDDYQLVQSMTKSELESQAIDEWVSSKVQNSYVRINDEYQSCDFRLKWVQEVK